jgi:hypothetical protein
MQVLNDAQMFETPRLGRLTLRVNTIHGKHAADPSQCLEILAPPGQPSSIHLKMPSRQAILKEIALGLGFCADRDSHDLVKAHQASSELVKPMYVHPNLRRVILQRRSLLLGPHLLQRLLPALAQRFCRRHCSPPSSRRIADGRQLGHSDHAGTDGVTGVTGVNTVESAFGQLGIGGYGPNGVRRGGANEDNNFSLSRAWRSNLKTADVSGI